MTWVRHIRARHRHKHTPGVGIGQGEEWPAASRAKARHVDGERLVGGIIAGHQTARAVKDAAHRCWARARLGRGLGRWLRRGFGCGLGCAGADAGPVEVPLRKGIKKGMELASVMGECLRLSTHCRSPRSGVELAQRDCPKQWVSDCLDRRKYQSAGAGKRARSWERTRTAGRGWNGSSCRSRCRNPIPRADDSPGHP